MYTMLHRSTDLHFSGGDLFSNFRFVPKFALSSSHPTNKCPFLEEKRKKRENGRGSSFLSKTWRKKKVAFPDPFVPWKNIRVGARRCRKQTPNAYEIRMKYLYVCGKQLLLPLLSPRGTRSRNGILISKEIFGHLEIAII